MNAPTMKRIETASIILMPTVSSIPVPIVLATFSPKSSAPSISSAKTIMTAFFSERAPEPTGMPMTFAALLAPMFHATKNITVTARIMSSIAIY